MKISPVIDVTTLQVFDRLCHGGISMETLI